MKKRHWGQILFWAYVIVMLWLLLGQRIGMERGEEFLNHIAKRANLTPLKTIRHYCTEAMKTTDWEKMLDIMINLVGNVVMFAPLGFFLPLNWEKYRVFWKWLVCVTVIIVVIECMQMLTCLGYLDVDDLILNLVGSGLGYGIWNAAERMRR